MNWIKSESRSSKLPIISAVNRHLLKNIYKLIMAGRNWDENDRYDRKCAKRPNNETWVELIAGHLVNLFSLCITNLENINFRGNANVCLCVFVMAIMPTAQQENLLWLQFNFHLQWAHKKRHCYIHIFIIIIAYLFMWFYPEGEVISARELFKKIHDKIYNVCELH